MTAADRRATVRRRFRQRLLVAFALLMVIGYAKQLATSPTAGQDFRVFFAAGTVVAQGGDPYDWPTLARAENRLYNLPQRLTPSDPRFSYFLAYPEGPWLAFALVPLAGLPWQDAFALYVVVLSVALGCGAVLAFTLLGWTGPRRTAAVLCACLSPVAFLSLFFGQASVPVFAAVMAAWGLQVRGRPALGGLVLSLVWVKPNLGIILPLALVLIDPGSARRLALGFAAGTVALFGVAVVRLGSGFVEWPMQVPRMWQAVQGVQPDMASIESFYYPALSGLSKTIALVATLIVAASATFLALRHARPGVPRGLTLIVLWLATLPFVQSYDLVLLIPVMAALLGADLAGWQDPWVEACVWAFMLVPLAYFAGARLGPFNGFTAIPVALLLFAWYRHVVRRPRTEPAWQIAGAA